MPHISEIINKGYLEGVVPEALLELILKFISVDVKDETKAYISDKLNKTKIPIPSIKHYLTCKSIEFFCEEIEVIIEEQKLPEFEINSNIILIPEKLLYLFLDYFEEEDQRDLFNFLLDRLIDNNEYTRRLYYAIAIEIGELIEDLDNMTFDALLWLFDENGNSIFD